MRLNYKKGDVLTRIMARNGKFVIIKYETLNDPITIEIGGSAVSVPLQMIYTDDEDIRYIEGGEINVYISTTFIDDGIEKRIPNMGDLFIIGDKEEIINKAKANILSSYNICFREYYLRKK